jgi:hypothetical protein
VYSIPVLWYSIGRTNLVTPVIARHPTSTMHDDFFFPFFFPTDLDAGAPRVASQRAGRWSIECVNRQVKQILGAEDPQCRRHQGPEHAASLSLGLCGAQDSHPGLHKIDYGTV